MKKDNKLLISLMCFLLCALLIAGIAVYAVMDHSAPVAVYSIQDSWLYTTYWQNDGTSYGTVSADGVQAVYLSATQEVTAINVQQGQQVTAGQTLLTFDTTLSQLSLDRKKLEIEKSKMRLSDYKAQLVEIKKMKPISYNPGASTPSATTKPTTPTDLGQLSEAGFRYRRGMGTPVNPAIFWVKEGLVFDTDTIQGIMNEKSINGGDALYAILEVRQDDLGTGKVTSRFGVHFIRDFVPAEDPTVPAEPTEPSEDPTEETTEPTGESTEPTQEDVSGIGEGDESALTVPASEDVPSSEATAQRSQRGSYTYSFSFFAVTDADDEDSSDSGTSNAPSIDMNSGYTSSQIAQMRADMEAQIKEQEFSIKMSEAEYKIMQKEFDTGVVASEINGYVISVLSVEEALATGEPIIRVSAGGSFKVQGTVSELQLSTLHPGQSVEVMSPYDGTSCTGTITEIGSYPVSSDYYGDRNPNVSYYPYTVTLDSSASLQAGDYVQLTYDTKAAAEDTLYLDAAFVRTENGKYFVYVQDSTGYLEKRELKVGGTIYDGSYIEIRGGLTISDWIAFPYGKDVKAGAPAVQSTTDELYGSMY